MVYTVCHQKEQSNYGLHFVSLERSSLIMIYTVCHQKKQSMVHTVCHQKEQSNYGLHCVSLGGAV